MTHTAMKDHSLRGAFNRVDLSSIRVPLILSLLNQMLSSGGNFLLGIYLARVLPLADFGLYGIGFGICMLYVGVGSALILTQMVVNMPSKPAAEKEQYATRMLCAVLLFCMLLLALVAVSAAVVLAIRPDYWRFMMPLSAITLASAMLLCSEFFISYAYMKHRESLALMINALTMATLFGGLVILHVSGVPISAARVLLLYALGALVGSAVAYWNSSLSLMRDARTLLPDFIESWRYGRWALGGVIVTWLQAQTYTYVLAFFLGPAGVGQANAAKIFISPFSFLLPAINKVAIPRLAELRQTDYQKMLRVSVLLTACMSLLTILYSALLLGSLDFVFHTILGRKDPLIESLVWVWCLVLIFQMVRSGGGVLLQVQRKFRILALINIPSALVTIAAAVLLIHWLGTAGAIWGMAAGEMVLLLLIWKAIRDGNDAH